MYIYDISLAEVHLLPLISYHPTLHLINLTASIVLMVTLLLPVSGYGSSAAFSSLMHKRLFVCLYVGACLYVCDCL